MIQDPTAKYHISGVNANTRFNNYVIVFSVRSISAEGQAGEWGYAPPMIASGQDSLPAALAVPAVTASESGGSIELTANTLTGQRVFGRLSSDGEPVSFEDPFQRFNQINLISNPVAARTYFWELVRGRPNQDSFSESQFLSYFPDQEVGMTTAPTGLSLELDGGILVATWNAVTGVTTFEWDLQGVFGGVQDWKRTTQRVISNGNIRNNLPYRFYLRAIGSDGTPSEIVSASLTASGNCRSVPSSPNLGSTDTDGAESLSADLCVRRITDRLHPDHLQMVRELPGSPVQPQVFGD